MVFGACDEDLDQGFEVVLGCFESVRDLLDTVFLLGKGVLADEPRPEFAGGATCKVAAIDGLLGKEAGALFDRFDHFFAGEDIGKEVAFVAFFVGVLGIDEVEAAAGGVVFGIGARTGLFEFRVGGGVVHRQESRFDPAAPMGSGRFDRGMAELAAAAFHKIRLGVAVVIGGRKTAGRGLEEAAEESIVEAIGAATIGGEFKEVAGKTQDARSEVGLFNREPGRRLVEGDFGDGVILEGTDVEGRTQGGLVTEEVGDRAIDGRFGAEEEVGVRFVFGDDIVDGVEHLIIEGIHDLDLGGGTELAPAQARSGTTVRRSRGRGASVGLSVEGDSFAVLGVESADFEFFAWVPVGADHDEAFTGGRASAVLAIGLQFCTRLHRAIAIELTEEGFGGVVLGRFVEARDVSSVDRATSVA